MTPTLRSLRRPIFAATAVAALGIGVPMALALTDAPERPRLEPVTATTTSPPPGVTPVVAASAGDSIEVGGDFSGPCDEAEHANDPACVGVATATTRDGDDGDDNSGRGSSGDDDEDRSGSNSGKG